MGNLSVSQRSGTGRTVPYMADIAWWGTHDWRTMYDWPKFQSTTNHLPISNVWDICQTRDNIRKNNLAIDKHVADLLDAPVIRFA